MDSITFITAVGVIVTVLTFVVQKHISTKLARAELLTNLEISFRESSVLMELYNKLEEFERSEQFIDNKYTDYFFAKENISHIIAYLTFFETLYVLLNEKIIKIKHVDDLFGYRFFIIINHPLIQEIELKDRETSYINIFKLYRLWYDYRNNKKVKDERKIPLENTSLYKTEMFHKMIQNKMI